MSAADEPLFLAVEELNRRMARSHRRMTLATTVISIVTGIAAVARLLLAAGVEGTGPHLLAATLLFTTLATFAAGAALGRMLLRGRRDGWARQLGERFGVEPAEIASYALPFGGAPESEPKGRTSPTRIALALLLVGCTIAVLVASPEGAVFNVAVAVVGVSFSVAFNRYLGWRAPP
ncbi:MAG: hypothetical protein U0359_09135 [Byssovorax sp.]